MEYHVYKLPWGSYQVESKDTQSCVMALWQNRSKAKVEAVAQYLRELELERNNRNCTAG